MTNGIKILNLILRPYKKNLLDSHPPFSKELGQEEAFYIYTHQDASKNSICTRCLVKGRYCAHAMAIKFVETACKNWDGRGENQVNYFMWPNMYGGQFLWVLIFMHGRS